MNGIMVLGGSFVINMIEVEVKGIKNLQRFLEKVLFNVCQYKIM
jgi:hypothetical protein